MSRSHDMIGVNIMWPRPCWLAGWW